MPLDVDVFTKINEAAFLSLGARMDDGLVAMSRKIHLNRGVLGVNDFADRPTDFRGRYLRGAI